MYIYKPCSYGHYMSHWLYSATSSLNNISKTLIDEVCVIILSPNVIILLIYCTPNFLECVLPLYLSKFHIIASTT